MSVTLEIHPDSPAGTRAPGGRPTGLDYAYALLMTAAIGLSLLATTPALWHWFVLPSAACGILIGGDAVRWARGRTGLFDPVGLIGAIGYHFFFLAPLLHVRWQHWLPYVTGPDDWRPWLGVMALLNVGGIIVYRFTFAFLTTRTSTGTPLRRHWRLEPTRLWPAFTCVIALSAAVETLAWMKAGGVRGFEQAVLRESNISGLGWMLAIGEAFPMLCFTAWLIRARLRSRRISAPLLVGGFFIFVLCQFSVGGLRGSRSNLIWPVFIALGVVHLTIRPISRRLLLVVAMLGLVFMYLYGFYKYEGFLGTYRFLAGDRGQLETDSHRTVSALLLGDLGRSDIQAYLLYRYKLPGSDYRLQYGGTYIGDVASLVPQAIWSGRPPGKLKAGTELMYGTGTYSRQYYQASNIYGMGGAALLNFGVGAIPLSYALLGAVVWWVQRLANGLAPDDTRLYLVPLLGVLTILCLTSDLGNVLFAALQFGLLLSAVLWVGSQRVQKGGPARS